MRNHLPIPLVGLVVLVTACLENPEVTPVTGDPEDPPIVSPMASAIGAALDHVAALPANRDPIRQGSRIFEVSGILVRVAPGIAAGGLESVIRERGWTLVEDGVDPRICDDDMPDRWGWPHCVLAVGDPKALYLDIPSAAGTGSDGYDVAIRAYRNVSVRYDRWLRQGAGFANDAEYDRLVTQLSDHPGVLNGTGPYGDPGTFHVTIGANGAAGHARRGPPMGPGPLRYSPEELAWDEKGLACHQLRRSGDKSGHRECMREYWEFGKTMLAAFEARAAAAVIAAEERGRK